MGFEQKGTDRSTIIPVRAFLSGTLEYPMIKNYRRVP